jgi:hypothetical protein
MFASVMQFTTNMDISNDISRREKKDSLDQSTSSALPSTMFTNGNTDRKDDIESISVSTRISACIVAQEAKELIKKFVDDAKKFAKIAKKFAEEAGPPEEDKELLEEEAELLEQKAELLEQKTELLEHEAEPFDVKEANEFADKARQFAEQAKSFVRKKKQKLREKLAEEVNQISAKANQLEKTADKAAYAWCAQARTVVAVVKFEKVDGRILYEARYTNCGREKKHAEDFFKEDIENENGVLAEIVQENPKGTITMYPTIQPCNQSTSETGTENTNADQSCCDILETIVGQTLQNDGRNINLCIKATNTNRLSQIDKNPNLRDNAVNGIKNLMGIESLNVSGMTREDWHYLLSLTNELENRKDLEVHEGRQDLDASVKHIFNEIQAKVNEAKINPAKNQKF